MPGVARSEPIANLSHFRRLMYLRFDGFPFFSTRDVVLVGYGDVWSRDSVMVTIQSIDDGSPEHSELKADHDAKSAKDNTVRIGLRGGFLFEAISTEETRCTTMLKIDIKIRAIPDAIIDWIMKHLAAFFLPMLHKQSRKLAPPKGPLAHLRTDPQNAPVYEEMERRLKSVGATAPAADSV